MTIDPKKILPVVWDYCVLTAGVLIYCIAWESFLIPNEIASGGLTGACSILQYATGGAIDVSTSYFILNATLITLATFILGKSFGIRTIYCILLSSVIFKVIPNMEWLQCIEGQFLYVDSKLLIAVLGGLIEAIAVGIILQRDGSTGGSDIIAMILSRFWPISPGKFFLYSDLVIIMSVLLVPGKAFVDMVYGYVSMITFSFMVDFVLLGSKSSAQVLVFSEKFKEIADYIINDLDRGVTALNGIGWYTQSEKKVLLILVRKSQVHELTKAVKSIDDNAFVSVSPASSVFGEGFEQIKTGLNVSKKNKT